MGQTSLQRRAFGALGVLLGLGIAAWVIAGTPGLIGAGDDELWKDTLCLVLALILVGSGVLMCLTRREDFESHPMTIRCASCEYERRSEPGDVCPQCGSRRLVLPRLNRAALGSLAILFGVPPLWGLSYLIVNGARVVTPRTVVALTACLFVAASSAFVLWQGRLPGPSFFMGLSMRQELERILYSKAYAVATILACALALILMTALYFSLQ